MPSIRSIELEAVSFPLKQPFITAAGRKERTDNVQIAVILSDGTRGRAEASSSISMASESQSNMLSALTHLIPELRGEPIADYKALAARIWRLSRFHPTAAAALECALIDARARVEKKSLAAFLGGKNVTIETDLTFSIGEPDALHKQVLAARRLGFRRFKVKLAGQPAKDLERLQAVCHAAPGAALVADGNQGFTLTKALLLVHNLERVKIPLTFLEQPFPLHDLKSMRLLRKKTSVPVFADESAQGPQDAVRVFEADAADGINVKLAKCGLLGALDMISLAKRFGKRLAIGCMEESKVGLAASVHLACGTGAFEWVDLDSIFLLSSPPPRGGFHIQGPHYSVKGIGPGIGL